MSGWTYNFGTLIVCSCQPGKRVRLISSLKDVAATLIQWQVLHWMLDLNWFKVRLCLITLNTIVTRGFGMLRKQQPVWHAHLMITVILAEIGSRSAPPLAALQQPTHYTAPPHARSAENTCSYPRPSLARSGCSATEWFRRYPKTPSWIFGRARSGGHLWSMWPSGGAPRRSCRRASHCCLRRCWWSEAFGGTLADIHPCHSLIIDKTGIGQKVNGIEILWMKKSYFTKNVYFIIDS